MPGRSAFRLLVIAVCLAGGTLLVESLASWRLAGAIAYAAFALICLFRPSRLVVLTAAISSTAAAVGGCLGGEISASPLGLVLEHCVLWAGATWLTAALLLRRRANEEQLARFFDLSIDPLCIAGFDGYFKRVNRAFQTLLGYPAGELLRRPYLDFVHPEDRARTRAEEERLASGAPTVEFENRYRRKDGSYRWLAWAAYPLLAQGLIYCAARDVTERRQAEEALRAHQAALEVSGGKLRELTGKLIAAQETERKRLARDLHDGPAQTLAVLANEAGQLAEQGAGAGGTRELRARLLTLQERLGDLAEELRGVSHRLHPATLYNVGLAAALEAECEQFAKMHPIAVRFEAPDSPLPLSEHLSLALYRVAREALANVANHSRASEVKVSLRRARDRVLLLIADKGVGFDYEAVRRGGGLGLLSMQERVRLVGGRLKVSARPGLGTEIEVEAPFTGKS